MPSSKNATCYGFLACPLPSPSPKELYRKYFSTIKHRSSALQMSCSDCGIYCFTFKNETLKIISWCPCQLRDRLIKMQKAVTTLFSVITAFNRVYTWAGMWRQRNRGCILFELLWSMEYLFPMWNFRLP